MNAFFASSILRFRSKDTDGAIKKNRAVEYLETVAKASSKSTPSISVNPIFARRALTLTVFLHRFASSHKPILFELSSGPLEEEQFFTCLIFIKRQLRFS